MIDEDSMANAIEAVKGESGGVDALVNNAGYSQSGPVETIGLDDVRRQFETNVFGLIRMCQLVLPGMREKGHGRIVNISSMGGRLVLPGGGAYHATKYSVEALSDALRFEVAGFGVKVIIVEPGLITTSFEDTAVASKDGMDGGGPDAVDKVIERPINARGPGSDTGPRLRRHCHSLCEKHSVHADGIS